MFVYHFNKISIIKFKIHETGSAVNNTMELIFELNPEITTVPLDTLACPVCSKSIFSPIPLRENEVLLEISFPFPLNSSKPSTFHEITLAQLIIDWNETKGEYA